MICDGEQLRRMESRLALWLYFVDNSMAKGAGDGQTNGESSVQVRLTLFLPGFPPLTINRTGIFIVFTAI